MSYQKDMEKYLITGAAGQLGQTLQCVFGGEEGSAMGRARESFDIADTENVSDWIPTIRPDAVINCAAYTNVPQAEKDREQCWKVNTLGVDNLARTCSAHNIPLFHISTDFVFGQDFSRCMSRGMADMSSDRWRESREARLAMLYREECPVGPLGYYAMTKAAGEHAILNHAAANPDFDYYIIRTAGLFSLPSQNQNNFPYKIARKLVKKNGQPLKIVADVYTNICHVDHLAEALKWMVENRNEWSSEIGPVVGKGIYHICNRGEASWFEIAERIAGHLGYGSDVVPCTREQYADSMGLRPGSIPSYTCMDTSKYHDTFGPPMPTWQAAVDAWLVSAKGYFR